MIASAASRSRPTAAAIATGLITLVIGSALGALWCVEGVVKIRSGFGSADILLVADGASGNTRVPGWFAPLGALMRGIPAVFGIGIPVLELALGAVFAVLAAGALLAVLRRRPAKARWRQRIATIAAVASGGTLALYWASDQLIAQYPAMLLLSLLLLALEALMPPAVIGTSGA